MSDRNLIEYLDDHLAGLLAARELARHCKSRNVGNDLAEFLDRLNAGLQKEHDRIKSLLTRYKSQESLSKMLGAWAIEKAGRLKLNRVVLGYSDLSRVTELETLHAALQAQADMWELLRIGRPDDARVREADPALAQSEMDAYRRELKGFLDQAALAAFTPSHSEASSRRS